MTCQQSASGALQQQARLRRHTPPKMRRRGALSAEELAKADTRRDSQKRVGAASPPRMVRRQSDYPGYFTNKNTELF
jgi:hypothetical protein